MFKGSPPTDRNVLLLLKMNTEIVSHIPASLPLLFSYFLAWTCNKGYSRGDRRQSKGSIMVPCKNCFYERYMNERLPRSPEASYYWTKLLVEKIIANYSQLSYRITRLRVDNRSTTRNIKNKPKMHHVLMIQNTIIYKLTMWLFKGVKCIVQTNLYHKEVSDFQIIAVSVTQGVK